MYNIPEGTTQAISNDTLLEVGDRFYKIQTPIENGDFTIDEWLAANKKYNPSITPSLEEDVAYLIGPDYFYLYRGAWGVVKDVDVPGIYLMPDGTHKIVHPTTPEDCDYYRFSDKITNLEAKDLVDKVLNSQIIIFNTPDSSHSIIPPETMEDDILKRALKRAISNKAVQIDSSACRARFLSKNMLFNLKSVMRSDNKLSMLLFDRGTEALNLKYTIIIEENGGDIIGNPLPESIVISSSDVYDANVDISDEDFYESDPDA